MESYWQCFLGKKVCKLVFSQKEFTQCFIMRGKKWIQIQELNAKDMRQGNQPSLTTHGLPIKNQQSCLMVFISLTLSTQIWIRFLPLCTKIVPRNFGFALGLGYTDLPKPLSKQVSMLCQSKYSIIVNYCLYINMNFPVFALFGHPSLWSFLSFQLNR